MEAAFPCHAQTCTVHLVYALLRFVPGGDRGCMTDPSSASGRGGHCSNCMIAEPREHSKKTVAHRGVSEQGQLEARPQLDLGGREVHAGQLVQALAQLLAQLGRVKGWSGTQVLEDDLELPARVERGWPKSPPGWSTLLAMRKQEVLPERP